MKSARYLFTAAVTLLLALMLINCGSPAADSGASGCLKVAAVFTTPIDEPWDGCIHQALLRAEQELGIEYKFAESVAQADVERVVREFADNGYQLIMGDAFSSEEAIRRAAAEYPEVAFCFGSGLGPVEPNVAVFDDWIHEPAYLCGMLAGKLTGSNVIGIVGGYPVPEVNRIVNAYIAGAKEVNPDVKAKVIFINSWFNPATAKESALALIDQGADVLYAERYGVIEAAAENKLFVFGNMQDQNHLAPDYVVNGPVWDMWPTVKHVIESVEAGTFQAMDMKDWSMMQKGGAYLSPFHGFEQSLDPALMTMVKDRQAEILNGLFRVPVDENQPVSD